jgi:cysteine-rich repeat protein
VLARWGLALALVSCVQTNSVRCPDGSVCPDGTQCATVDDATLCVSPEDTSLCVGRDEFFECAVGKRCYQGVCLPAGCGNHRVEPGEVCDDGNHGAGDGCAADCSSDETCGNGTIDLVDGEQCDDGADVTLSHDGCAADCTLETPRWVPLPMPSQLDAFPAWSYDSKRGRIVLFGSFNNAPKTLEWDGRRWFVQEPAISPPPRQRHAMAYDAARARTVLFGGTNLDDTWERDSATWTLAVTPLAPPARADHTLVYDAARKRVVLFGGRTLLDNNGLADTWTWDGQAWTQIATPSPGRRFDHGAAYDPKRGVVVIYGGSHQDVESSETWELAGTTWTPRTPPTTPGARRAHAMTFDPTRGRVVLHGGVTGTSTFFLDTWTYDGVDWEKLDIPDVITTANGASPIIATFAQTGTVVTLENRTDLYRLTPTGWERSEISISVPSHRSFAAAAADLAGGRILIHAGIQGAFISPATQIYTGIWSVVSTGPGAMTGGAMAFDEKRRQFVLFGGARSDGTSSQETWVFENGVWTKLVVQPADPVPTGRDSPVMVYDAKRERIVLFGGRTPTGVLGDTWTWDGASWVQLSPALSPSARMAAAATYDPVRDEVIVFGGTTANINGTALRDTWTWNGTTWAQRATTGPAARFASAMAWDAARRRAVMFGGAAPFLLNDQWEWDGTSWTQLSVSSIQAPRSGHVMLPSLEGFGVLVNGGLSGTPSTGDLQRLGWDGPAIDETCVEADLDGDGLAGCADPDCWRVCKPACPPGATFMCTATCGNGTCDAVESCQSCSADCGACPATCGDFTCSETAATCPGDCP